MADGSIFAPPMVCTNDLIQAIWCYDLWCCFGFWCADEDLFDKEVVDKANIFN